MHNNNMACKTTLVTIDIYPAHEMLYCFFFDLPTQLIVTDLSLPAQVHILSHFIMNGVCVRWKGRIDLDKLDGTGCLEFDEERAMVGVGECPALRAY
jgi:hypothetical protein